MSSLSSDPLEQTIIFIENCHRKYLIVLLFKLTFTKYKTFDCTEEIRAVQKFVGEVPHRERTYLKRTIYRRAAWIRKTLPEPWGHPVLLKLIDQSGPQPSQEEG